MGNVGDYFNSANSLVKSLINIDAIGDALCEIAKRRYTWDVVRKQYVKFFRL
jgi:hypothetical protein